MASVFKETRRDGKKSTYWYIKYRDAKKRWRKVRGFKDKKATDQKAAELERDAERLVAGLHHAIGVQLKKPIAQHLADYRAFLEGNGRTPKYINSTISTIERVAVECGFVFLIDYADGGPDIARFLRKRKQQGNLVRKKGAKDVSARTINSDLTALRMFSNWLIQQDRLERDPTLGLEKLNEEEDRRLVRRALSDEEAEWLIDTTLKSEGTFRGQTGEARALLYVVGLRTGFRRGELLSLTPQSFRLFGTNPMVKAAAKATKNRKQAEQPLPADLAAWIADYTRGLPPDAPVWPHKNLGWWHRTAEMVRHDLQAARQAWLDDSPTSAVRSAREKTDFLKYRDADGQQVDFHGHRHTFVTTLARHGVPTSSIQYLARHSDYKTTQRYVHTALGDVAGFVDQLPELGPRRPADVIRATGTNDASPGSERRADHGADQTFRTDRRGGLNGANGDRGKIATRSRPRNPKTPGTKGVAGLDGEQIDTLEAEGTGLEPARPCGPSDFEADANAETQCRKELTAQGLRVVTEEEVPSADHGADQSLAEAAAKPASRKMLEDMLARRRPGSKQLAAMLEEMGVPPAERKAVLTLVAGAVKRRKAKPRQKAAGA